MKILNQLIICFALIISNNAQSQSNTDLLSVIENDLPILIQNVSIFNGKDSVLQTNMNVIIEDGMIKSIKHKEALIIPKKYHIINGTGKTVIPGLIDSHVHLQGNGSVPWEKVQFDIENNLSAYLYSGITTVYDLGGLSSKSEKFKRSIHEGKFIGPDIYHSHIPITVKNSHPIPLTKEMLPWPLKSLVGAISPTISSPEDAKKLLKSYSKQKIDYVKIICDQIPSGTPEMSFENMKAICDESHQLGFKVFAHIGSPQNAVDAVSAGVDVLAHGIWRGKLTESQADIIAKSGVPVIYTLAGFINVNDINHGHFTPSEIDELLIPKGVICPVKDSNGLDVQHQEVMSAFFNDVSESEPYWLSNFKLLNKRNVPIIIGTDSSLPGTYAGSTYYQEIDELSEFGLTNFDILRGATSLASELFLNNPNFGTVEIGKKANLLIVKGNPLLDLSTIKYPELILLNGEMIIRK